MATTLKNIIFYFNAGVAVKILGVFKAFFIAKMLQPADYGLWTTLSIIVSYAPIISFGTVEALLKKYPYYIEKGETFKAKEIEKGVLGSIILSVAVFLSMGFTFNYFFSNKEIDSILFLIRLTVITSALSLLSGYFYHRFTAHQLFKIISIIDVFRSALTFLIVIVCSFYWGLTGTVISFLLCEIVVLIFSIFANRKLIGEMGTSYNFKLLADLVRIGFPITALWWVFILQTSADRMVAISMLGKVDTGYYGLGVSIVSMVVLLPSTVARVLYPKVSGAVGKLSSRSEIISYVVKPTQALSLLLPVLIGGLILACPYIYTNILPKYYNGLASAQILLIGSFFICQIRTGANYLIANDRQNILLGYFLISLVVNIVGNISLVKLGFNIEGIAISTSFSGALLASIVWINVFKEMGYGVFERIKLLLEIYLPFLILSIIFVVSFFIYPNFLNTPSLFCMVNMAVFLFLFIGSILLIPPLKKRSTDLIMLTKNRF